MGAISSILELLRKLLGGELKTGIPQDQCTILWGYGIAVKLPKIITKCELVFFPSF